MVDEEISRMHGTVLSLRAEGFNHAADALERILALLVEDRKGGAALGGSLATHRIASSDAH